MLIRSEQKISLDELKIDQTKIIVASGWQRAPELDFDLDISAFFCGSEHTVG